MVNDGLGSKEAAGGVPWQHVVAISSIYRIQQILYTNSVWAVFGRAVTTSSTEAREEGFGFETGVIGTGKGHGEGQAVTLTKKRKIADREC